MRTGNAETLLQPRPSQAATATRQRKCRSSRQVPSPLGTLQPPKPVQPVFVEESPANRIPHFVMTFQTQYLRHRTPTLEPPLHGRRTGLPDAILLGLASIQRNGGFRSDSLQTYGGDCPENLLVEPGELYVSLKDVTQAADLLGAVAMLPSHHDPGRLTQDTVKLEPTCHTIPLNYIYWLLRTPECRDYC